jgi:Tfp pilus assembly protein PilP
MKNLFLTLFLLMLCLGISTTTYAAKDSNAESKNAKGKNSSKDSKSPKETEKVKELTIEDIAQLEQEDSFVFEPFGKRDPFEPPVAVRDVNIPSLERFPLDAFKITGIMWDSKVPKAVIKDPSGKQTVATLNTKIGINHGYIRTIREGEVVVIENIYEDGQFTKKAQVLGLSKAEVTK